VTLLIFLVCSQVSLGIMSSDTLLWTQCLRLEKFLAANNQYWNNSLFQSLTIWYHVTLLIFLVCSQVSLGIMSSDTLLWTQCLRLEKFLAANNQYWNNVALKWDNRHLPHPFILNSKLRINAQLGGNFNYIRVQSGGLQWTPSSGLWSNFNYIRVQSGGLRRTPVDPLLWTMVKF
jgi:hypothetical protein